MAPVKRAAIAAHRETRATRAAAVAKKHAIAAERNTNAASMMISDPAKKPATATRRSKRVVDELQHEKIDPEDNIDEPSKTADTDDRPRTKNIEATATATRLGAAPRRRIKVTPMDITATQTRKVENKSKASGEPKVEKKNEVQSRKKSVRSNLQESVLEDETRNNTVASMAINKSEAKSATRSKTKEKSKASKSSKKPAPVTTENNEQTGSGSLESERVENTRTTRSRRAASTLDPVTNNSEAEPQESQQAKGARKKVTFQDLPDIDEKENRPISQSKGKKGTIITDGLRARPLRKNVASSRTRNTTAGAVEASDKPAKLLATKKGKQVSRILTPKKITQIAKSSSPEQEDEFNVEGEDELNGAKTPIRDLSVSPRRPTTTALAKALSPAKKLDFGQSLAPQPLGRSRSLHESGVEQTGSLASPARRPVVSSFTDAMRSSPKRGLDESTRPLFPIRSEQTSSLSLAPNTSESAGQATVNILQSPRRVGVLGPNFFSQSAMKSCSTVSPLKSSLFGSPAKRLFSPSKKSVMSMEVVPREAETSHAARDRPDAMEFAVEVTASSHFRSSVSPLRVVRVNPEADDFDFDDSVLPVRSPLKADHGLFTTDASLEANGELCNARTFSEDRAEDLNIAEDPVESEAQDMASEVFDVAANTHVACPQVELSEQQKAEATRREPPSRRSLSQVLFRTNRTVNGEESSEDELAGDRTPVKRRSKHQSRDAASLSRLRLSNSSTSGFAGQNYGFTPLAIQMSNWLASSPDKSPEHTQGPEGRSEHLDFSPLAGQHIDGEVVISRHATPVRKLDKRTSMNRISSSRRPAMKPVPSKLRESLYQRQSVGHTLMTDSPLRDSQFEEYMQMREAEEQAHDGDLVESLVPSRNDAESDNVMDGDNRFANIAEVGGSLPGLNPSDDNEQNLSGSEELTTDLVKYTHASDTAIVDFQKLAEEADGLVGINDGPTFDSMFDADTNAIPDPQDSTEDMAEGREVDGSVAPAAAHIDEELPSFEVGATQLEMFNHDPQSPTLEPVDEQLDSPSMLVIDRPTSPVSPLYLIADQSPKMPSATLMSTPKPNLRLHEKRVINTVISKIPLKPEGSMSPIKVARKRSRSFGNTDASPAKRTSLGSLRPVPTIRGEEVIESPSRRLRTSVAPSPGGTSTPATSKSADISNGMYSIDVRSTPGQLSFAIDDFGDSTLDGIELPDGIESEADLTDDCASSFTTPRAMVIAAPDAARSSLRRATAPSSSARNTPHAVEKVASGIPKETTPKRTPLKAMGKGVLHGATVFVDVHTSEGADASGIFVELLTQMGAKCVKEWRWNLRASISADTGADTASQKVGVTHVVYKDGGKRTLEKVRDTKGEVCCVGVGWVLDCERQRTWLDEASYAIDLAILPRGGSQRRKSMEPRALLVSNNGSVSASRPRRSVSAEMSQAMQRELVGTPLRRQNVSSDNDEDGEDEDIDQATPTGFVSYDPRMAMTPGTPYLISQGKQISQMSAPPKQQNKPLFENDDEENDDMSLDYGNRGSDAVKDAKKFRMRNLGDMAKRRRTLGWKPVTRSPLGRG